MHDYVVNREEVGTLPEDVQIEMSELLKEIDDYKKSRHTFM